MCTCVGGTIAPCHQHFTHFLSRLSLLLFLALFKMETFNLWLDSKASSVIKEQEGTHTVNSSQDFPSGTVGKIPPANAGDMGSIPALGRPHVLQSN